MAEEEENLVVKYNYCVYHTGEKMACAVEIVDGLIVGEMKAQRQYGQAIELFPQHKIALLEIKGDEGDHEKKLRQIMMQITQKTIIVPARK